jgi:hypothetical protein
VSTQAIDPEVIDPAEQNAAEGGAPVEKTGFGTTEVRRAHDAAAVAQAARAKAIIESRLVIALQRPRKWPDVRIKLLAECKRPGFPESAWYQVENRGEGLSIRFAEAAMRCMGNVSVDTTTVYDDDGSPGVAGRRVLYVEVHDMESNYPIGKAITIMKQVERKQPRGREVIRERLKGNGEKVFIVRATEEELLGIENSHVSKTIRGAALRILPGDIKDECEAEIVRALREGIAADPGAALKRVCDAFATMNVMPSELAEYLGHDVDKSMPAEIAGLRGLYTALKNGETTWAQAIEAKATAPKSRTDALAEKLGAKPAQQAGAPAPAAAATAPRSAEQEAVENEGAAAARRQESAKMNPHGMGTPERVWWLAGHTREANALSRAGTPKTTDPEPGSAG